MKLPAIGRSVSTRSHGRVDDPTHIGEVMPSEKVYGRDGPPQLRGRVEEIPLEDVPKFYGEEGS